MLRGVAPPRSSLARSRRRGLRHGLARGRDRHRAPARAGLRSSTVIWRTRSRSSSWRSRSAPGSAGASPTPGPRPQRMHGLLLGGAGLLGLTPVLATPLLGAGVRALDEISAPGLFRLARRGAAAGGDAAGLLGARPRPYAVRLALGAVEATGDDAVARAGRTAGRLSALATGGSLIGTFVAALALIPARRHTPHLLAVRAAARDRRRVGAPDHPAARWAAAMRPAAVRPAATRRTATSATA